MTGGDSGAVADPPPEVVLAGFGGQGILLAGRLLAGAALRAGLNVLVHSYYEGFVRGGVSECTVVLARGEIDSPVRRHPAVIAALDGRAVADWAPRARSGGLLLWNSALVDAPPERDDVQGFPLPASALAGEIGNAQCVSMVAVGALAVLTRVCSVDDCVAALPDVVPPSRKAMVAVNEAALRRGAAFAGATAPRDGADRILRAAADGAL